jgi:eukaryotic-like serine/threonine-protein kinase
MDLQRASTATWSGPGARARRWSSPEPAGERLGVYVVERLLGEGGMARVYRARHTVIDRPVAIKRLLPELAGLPEAHGLLLREARIAGTIRHSNLLEIFDFGYDPLGRPYYVMELAAGETLARRLADGPLLASQALDVAIEVADAVAAVHAAGYVHRDIKADNVMLARDGARLVLKLIDFGIACRVDEPADRLDGIAGTPRTMAPEQVARDPIDERTDVWGIGVLLYEMLTARLPFEPGGSLRDDLMAIVTDAPRPLPDDLDPGVRAIVDACLHKEPGERPADAAAVGRELRAVQAAFLAARGLRPRRAF